MGGKKLKALTAIGRTNWATGKFSCSGHMDQILTAFLWGCPLPGVSACGRSLSVFERVDNASAGRILAQFISSFNNNVDVFHSVELRQIAKQLINDKRAGDRVPRGRREFIYFSESQTGVLKDAYGLYSNIEKQDLRSNHRSPYINILILDGLLRHFRNSLAHGSFTEVRRRNASGKYDWFLYFQDANSRKQITARIYLSYDSLENLTTLLNECGE